MQGSAGAHQDPVPSDFAAEVRRKELIEATLHEVQNSYISVGEALTKIQDALQAVQDAPGSTISQDPGLPTDPPAKLSLGQLYDLAQQPQSYEPGIPLPYRRLNGYLGGLKKTRLVVLSGDSGHGKSTLALNIALHAAEHGHSCDVYSTEMSGEEILFKCYAILSGVAEEDLRRPGLCLHDETFTAEELVRIEQAREAMRTLPLYVDDTGENNLQGVLKKIGESTSELIIVDHLHNLSSGRENRVLDLEKCVTELKMLAMKKRVPILLLCHTRNREKAGEKSPGPPRLSDLYWSASIKQNANQVVFVYDRNQQDDATEISVAKNRHGMTCESIQCKFEPWCSRITEL